MNKFLMDHSHGVSFSLADKDMVYKAVDEGFIEEEVPGIWRLTEKGR